MLNNIKLHGYLGRNPELSYINGRNGQYARVAFTLGVGRDFGDETDWFYCTMIGKRAEVIDKYFSKGSEIIVSGRMESYRPKNDPDRIAWLVKMDSFDFTRNGTDRSSSGSSSPARQESQVQTAPTQVSFDDIPDSYEQLDEDIPF